MMRRLLDWVHGWWVTLSIRFREPELYRELTRGPLDPGDFTEAGPPA